MSLVPTSFRSFRPALTAALITLSLAVAARPSLAQTAIAGLFPIGLTHAEAKPYNFTGRVFDIDNVGFGSGTLLRRHTVQTAGHVTFEPATGFLTYATYTRALYEDVSISKDQIISAQALSGYQAEATAGADFLSQSSFDIGLVLVNQAPVDEDWSNYADTPSLLSTAPTFVVGYPGVSFDGRIMCYVVPTTHWVAIGSGTAQSALYEIDEATAEPGTSGGPIYVVPDGVNRYVEGSVVGTTTADSTGEFNNFLIRAIDKSAAKFIQAAEYTSGLISKVKITGPKTVSRGQTYTYTANVIFAQPLRDTTTGGVTTDRYTELKIKSSTPGTTIRPLVSVAKASNTTFNVTFSSNIQSGATTTLQVYYSGTGTPLGKSSLVVKVQ